MVGLRDVGRRRTTSVPGLPLIVVGKIKHPFEPPSHVALLHPKPTLNGLPASQLYCVNTVVAVVTMTPVVEPAGVDSLSRGWVTVALTHWPITGAVMEDPPAGVGARQVEKS